MNNKGITLIELIISIGLVSVLLMVLFNIFMFSTEVYSLSHSNIEMQEQAQTIQNFIENNLYLSSGIESIITKNGEKFYKDEFEKEDVKEIRFKIDGQMCSIYHMYNKKKVFIKKNLNYNGYEFGDYLENINIKNIDNGSGVEISLKLQKDRKTINTSFLIYFRNYLNE
ncbi:MAG: type II secretion system GspH family protein [Tepidibacter sp.]|jgi:Tfp pilus assembly protein PilE|uniref:PilW family protein n=1 Tax=Tepidibacter sp. TaxID=2529387 RepID=UPI0025F43889|nr:prepilin-type N-terminal cleavage/methylation domain-containing protein [Tepidibacter sp.]MCT4509822.1 type II secretion system GspH family protein [Tepidibacter sp.]